MEQKVYAELTTELLKGTVRSSALNSGFELAIEYAADGSDVFVVVARGRQKVW